MSDILAIQAELQSQDTSGHFLILVTHGKILEVTGNT